MIIIDKDNTLGSGFVVGSGYNVSTVSTTITTITTIMLLKNEQKW